MDLTRKSDLESHDKASKAGAEAQLAVTRALSADPALKRALATGGLAEIARFTEAETRSYAEGHEGQSGGVTHTTAIIRPQRSVFRSSMVTSLPARISARPRRDRVPQGLVPGRRYRRGGSFAGCWWRRGP